jgi:hypothetical protein
MWENAQIVQSVTTGSECRMTSLSFNFAQTVRLDDKKQDRQYTNNLTLWRVRATFIPPPLS